MQTHSPARPRGAELGIGSEELAEGLMLVRASTLKMIRLQLAMERQDRRVAIEAVDDLVALDRMLQDYIADVPADSDQLMFRQALDEERAMLNQEKLTLAAEVVRRDPPPLPVEAAPAEAEPLDAAAWDSFAFVEDEEPQPRRAWLWFALVLALLAAAAGAAWLLLGPDALQTLMAQIGAVR